jgi:putative Mg2+ transporter-C (MgtC) family protein
MPVTLTRQEIGIRLLCTAAAGALIGLNRSERGHAAGLRTSLLVSLAACVAMLQVNLLLPLAGKASNSFVMLDPMRLPLGILSGIGFIGAGAIVRRDNFVVDVTTAATIWYLTVIGLCFGGGQIALALVGSAIGLTCQASDCDRECGTGRGRDSQDSGERRVQDHILRFGSNTRRRYPGIELSRA